MTKPRPGTVLTHLVVSLVMVLDSRGVRCSSKAHRHTGEYRPVSRVKGGNARGIVSVPQPGWLRDAFLKMGRGLGSFGFNPSRFRRHSDRAEKRTGKPAVAPEPDDVALPLT